MELLDRYLYAVGNNMPPGKRDDILRELRANILEGVEDREATIGRKLTIDEEETVLRQYGHPVLVGMRYQPKQYLIGPNLFPYYLYALKMIVPLALLVYAVANVIAVAAQSFTPERLVRVLVGIPAVMVTTAVWITIVFAAFDFIQMKWPVKIDIFEKWSPKSLPKEKSRGYNTWKAVFEVSATGIGLVWYLLLPRFPFLALGPAALLLKNIVLAPEWTIFYWTFGAMMLVQWLAEMAGLFYQSARSYRQVIALAGRFASAVIFGLMAKIPTYVWLSAEGRSVAKAQVLVDTLNSGLRVGLKAMVLVFVLQSVWELAQLIMKNKDEDETAGLNGNAVQR